MILQFYKKSVVWGLIASLLNLLLVVALGSTMMAIPLEAGQPVQSLSQNTDAMPCHEHMQSASDQRESACDQHTDANCETDCASCFLAHIGVPVHSRQFTQETGSCIEGISIRLIGLSYSPNPPPPKRFS
jgi:hypothetical protein